MKKYPAAANPDAYVAALKGWQRARVERLRQATRGAAKLEEQIRWGHLVYSARGPVLLIRAEENRVLFGFWRGQRLAGIEPRLQAGGKYEMATLTLRAGDEIAAATVGKLVRTAVALNRKLGDPTAVAKPENRARTASDPDRLFTALRKVLAGAARPLVVVRDLPGDYYLDTRHVMKNGKPLFFGAVRQCKGYVSFYLMPLYVSPPLLKQVPASIARQLKGKSCFNFRSIDRQGLRDLARLVQLGLREYRQSGYLG